jgi:hypothetical protein
MQITVLDGKNAREHYIGPIMTGDMLALRNTTIRYVAGYYVGLGDDSADNAARLQLIYRYRF